MPSQPLGADRPLLGFRLNLDPLRLARLEDRNLDIQYSVVEPATDMIHIEPRRQGQGRVEPPVGDVSLSILLEALWRLALTLDYQLVVLHAHLHVLLANTREDRPQTQEVFVPA